MLGVHPLADLAPRDVVAKAIMRRMRETGAPHVWLDGRAARRRDLAAPVPDDPRVLPLRTASTRSPSSIPVAPAAHYASGGVRTDLRRPHQRPGPVRLRRVRLHRRARREPARVQLAARGAGVRRADRCATSPRGLPAAARPGAGRPARSAAGRVRPRARRGDDDRRRRRAAQPREPGSTLGRLRELGLRAGDPASRRPRRGRRRTCTPSPRSSRWPREPREETRGSHWREDFPDRDDVRVARRGCSGPSTGPPTRPYPGWSCSRCRCRPRSSCRRRCVRRRTR